MAAERKQPMNYERYILPHLLPEVRPREIHQDPLRADPDEQFFIRTHQAFEIWFAQILSELEYARLLLSQPPPVHVPETDVPVIEGHVRRAAFSVLGRKLAETVRDASELAVNLQKRTRWMRAFAGKLYGQEAATQPVKGK